MKNVNGVAVYENLREIVAPERSCLVVWDVQNGLVERIFDRDRFLAALQGLLAGLRGKVPAVYTLITPFRREFTSSWGYYSTMKRWGVDDPSRLPPFMAPGSREREIPEAVKPGPADLAIEKPTASIFVGTGFEQMMRNRGITALIFTGIATEVGIETSARHAGCLGFYPVVVSDCVSSSDREAHLRSLENLKKLAIVAESSAILQALG